MNTFGHHLAEFVKESGKVGVLGLNTLHFLIHVRGLEYIVDESQQQVAVVAYDVDVLLALLWIFHHVQHVREAHNGVQRSTYFVGHVGQECSFHLTRLLSPLGFISQFLLRPHEQGNVAHGPKMPLCFSVLVIHRHTADGIPRFVMG